MSTEERVNVSIRFGIGPFEVALSGQSNSSSVPEYIATLLENVTKNQDKIAKALTGVALTKIASVTAVKPMVQGDIEKVAGKMGVSVEKLKVLLRIENNTPVIIAKEKFSSPDRAALVLVYAYQSGLNRAPTHAEVSKSFKLSGYEDSFSKRSKGNLLKTKRIDDSDDKITLLGSGISDAEEEIRKIIG